MGYMTVFSNTYLYSLCNTSLIQSSPKLIEKMDHLKKKTKKTKKQKNNKKKKNFCHGAVVNESDKET